MKITKQFLSFTFLPLLLLARGCAKDSEEVYDEEQNYIEVHYGKNDNVTKDMAIESWETFIKQSQDLIDITETNISSLEIKTEEADGQEKIEMQDICNASNLTLLKLKARRLKRNKEFSAELKSYDPSDHSVQQKNEAFMKQFKRDMFDLNIALENQLEKSKTGYINRNHAKKYRKL